MHDACPFCELLKSPYDNPTFIAEFENTVAFLNFNQDDYKGQSILILKEHHDHLHQMPASLQQAVVPELSALTKALLEAFGGFRANHQSLGNQVSHVHWHITPRYPEDKNSGGPPVHTLQINKISNEAYRELSATIRNYL